MKRTLPFVLSALLSLLLICSASGEDRPVLTIGDSTTRSGNYYNAEMGMWQYIAEQAGVEIKYIYLTPEEYASALSSGNLPDIVATQNDLAAILESGVALNAAPYLEEYAPNLLKGEARLTYDVIKQLGNEGDGLYFFPAKIGYNGVGFDTATSQRGYIVRWDYYKELGYPPINNEDDYLNVLMQMHANHPFTEDGYPTYLYGTSNFNGYDTAFRAELSLDYWVAYKYQNNIFTNEIYDGYTDLGHSMWWANKAWHNKLFRAGAADGSYDLDIFTQTTEQYYAKCARGQYMGMHSVRDDLYRESVKTNPETLAGYATVPTAAANYYTNVYQLLGNGSGYMWFISANTQNVEAALRLFNCMADPDIVRVMTLGEQGVTWDRDADGVPRMTEYGQAQLDAYKAGRADADNYYVRWGSFDKFPNNWPILRDNIKHPDGYLIDFATISREYKAATMTNRIYLDMCEHYGVELPTDAFYQAGGLDFRNDCGEAITSCMSSLSREHLLILSKADAILEDAQLELILAETDDEFEAIRDETVQKIISLGEPEVFRAYREKWDAVAAVIVPLVREAQIANGIEPYTPEQYERFP